MKHLTWEKARHSLQFMLLPIALLLLVAAPVKADTEVAPNDCVKPEIPIRMRTTEIIRNFNDEAKTYRECIDKYVQKQQEAIKVHQKAAATAVEDWNSFAAEVEKQQQRRQQQPQQ